LKVTLTRSDGGKATVVVSPDVTIRSFPMTENPRHYALGPAH